MAMEDIKVVLEEGKSMDTALIGVENPPSTYA
jgi:hypothetical protein